MTDWRILYELTNRTWAEVEHDTRISVERAGGRVTVAEPTAALDRWLDCGPSAGEAQAAGCVDSATESGVVWVP